MSDKRLGTLLGTRSGSVPALDDLWESGAIRSPSEMHCAARPKIRQQTECAGGQAAVVGNSTNVGGMLCGDDFIADSESGVSGKARCGLGAYVRHAQEGPFSVEWRARLGGCLPFGLRLPVTTHKGRARRRGHWPHTYSNNRRSATREEIRSKSRRGRPRT